MGNLKSLIRPNKEFIKPNYENGEAGGETKTEGSHATVHTRYTVYPYIEG